MSVVLVIAVGLFLLRDNIAKFINNAATQIAGEESRPEGMNEYGFYFDKMYTDNYGAGIMFREDGAAYYYMDGEFQYYDMSGTYSYSSGTADSIENGTNWTFSSNGKSFTSEGGFVWTLQE